MAGIARQLEQEYPEVNEGVGTQLFTPIEANTDETLNMVFGAMMFAVICVLLVACANVASLLLSRAAMRTKEAGLRVALGGSRLRVMLPFLAESLVLAAAGAALGIAIAYTAVAWFDGVTDPALTGRPWFMQFRVDLPILLFVVGLTVVTALIAGLAPAFQMSRADVSTVLKDEARGSSGLQMGRLSRILVTAEVALSCALLVGAGLMTKSIVNLNNLEHPFETDRLFTARVGLFEADYPDEEARRQFWTDLTAEIDALPRVERAALTDLLPYQGRNTYEVSIDGVDYGDAEERRSVNRIAITPGYFEALRTELLSGRDFNDADDVGGPRVAIVNQPMVERYFDGQNPMGRSFRQGASDTLPSLTVVGVAPDLQMMGGQPEAAGEYEPAGYYVPVAQQDFRFLSIAALARGDVAGAVTGDVRAAVRRLDPNLPIYNVFGQSDVIERATWFYGVFGTVFIAFGLAALFMASVGLYGVLSFAVSRRTQEMGIRMALGAASGDVIRLVARQGAGQLALGLVIGLGLAFGVTRLVSVLMFQVDPQDPVVFGAVFTLIVAVGMAAAVFPARRATGVSPVQALRAE
jgi:predicted permease